jgi:hypothetical protein
MEFMRWQVLLCVSGCLKRNGCCSG